MSEASGEIAARRGNPSYVWRAGQARRLEMVRRYAPLRGQRILDVGCGIGTYVRQFRAYSPHVFGVDVEVDRLAKALAASPYLAAAEAEALPFSDGSFDLVFLHEVIEHVRDDRATIAEAARVVRPGGRVVIFAPNRFYPLETHGVYVRGRYHFGNIPLVNYLPDPLRNRFCPHVRAYTWGGLRALWASLPLKLVAHRGVYPGFDNIAARRPWLAKSLRRMLYFAENTFLASFGLSHFVVLEKCQE
ncbi:MAG: class I SAM-dependent methyltransferase [Actinobacteria bacterium]|nr:class I SAM-dependent methyltransferase [Actinomycetota bacterium]